MQRPKPLCLIILDGFGYREGGEDNAIAKANMKNWQHWWQHYPHTLIDASGRAVGLPSGQMGNSEVGHLNIGAGRIVQQDFDRIETAIADGSFATNPTFRQTFADLQQSGKALHILGLLSPGGVHSHEQQIFALIKAAAANGVTQVYLHAFLDGRDTPPQSAKPSLAAAEAILHELNMGHVASICGRYYAMDRDKRWERVQTAFDMLTTGEAAFHAENSVAALELAYARGETDEFVQATVVEPAAKINDGDAVVFMNYRADRARQLTQAFTDNDFSGFKRKAHPSLSHFICLTEYAANINAEVAFPPLSFPQVLGECLAANGLSQLRLAETEKYAHVTFFFNGGVETPFAGEERKLIPSPKVATYDLQPEMSAAALTDVFVDAIEQQQYDVIIANFANPDMVGHTGNLEAAIKAVTTVDECLGRIVKSLQAVDGEALITADHGNVEKMFDHETGQAHTAHTNLLVPLLYIGRAAEVMIDDGSLADIAPSLLSLLNLPIPAEMTGRPIFNIKE